MAEMSIFVGLFFGQKNDWGYALGNIWAIVMQKTEVFYIVDLFVGPFCTILDDFGHFLGLKSGVNFLG
jgi:hypothetical protein